MIGVSELTVPDPVPFPIVFVPPISCPSVAAGAPNSLHTYSVPFSINSTNCTVTPLIRVLSLSSLIPSPVVVSPIVSFLTSSQTFPEIILVASSSRYSIILIFGALSVSSSNFSNTPLFVLSFCIPVSAKLPELESLSTIPAGVKLTSPTFGTFVPFAYCVE